MASCTSFFAVVSGQTTVRKIFRSEPIAAATITDFYNRLNSIRSRHGLSSYSVPNLQNNLTLPSQISTLYSNITNTNNSISFSAPYAISVSQGSVEEGLTMSKIEKDIGSAEGICVHKTTNRNSYSTACTNNNSSNFTVVHAPVSGASTYGSNGSQIMSISSLATNSNSLISSKLKAGGGISIQATFRNFRNYDSSNRGWFRVCSGDCSFCDDRSGNKSGFVANTSDRGSFRSSFDSFRSSNFGSDFGSNRNSFFSSNFSDFGNVFRCDTNKVNNFASNNTSDFTSFNSSFCPVNYTTYQIEGIDF